MVQSEEGLAKVDECTKCRYGAPTVIIAAYDHDASAHPSSTYGPETCDFGDIDASIALTNMENAAAGLGLGTCWVGAFDPNAVRERFNVPESCKLVELLMVGHALAAMENAAAGLGLGTCWVGAFDPNAVRERFNVPESCKLVELLMVGHALAAPGPRHAERKAVKEFTTRESF